MLFLKIQFFYSVYNISISSQHDWNWKVLIFEYHSLFQTCGLFTNVVLVNMDRSTLAVVFLIISPHIFLLQWFSACSC